MPSVVRVCAFSQWRQKHCSSSMQLVEGLPLLNDSSCLALFLSSVAICTWPGENGDKYTGRHNKHGQKKVAQKITLQPTATRKKT